MKLPRFLAVFLNWVEGEEVVPVPARETASKRSGTAKKTPAKKPERRTAVQKDHSKALSVLYDLLAVIVCLTVILTLLVTVSWLPRFGGDRNPPENEVYTRYVENELEEAGAINTVAGMILDYRAFDTLGESNVLFIAVCSVIILLLAGRKEKDNSLNIPELEIEAEAAPDDSIFRCGAKLLVPLSLLFGIYVVLNGHLSAGGGFSGGAILGASLILYVRAYGAGKLEKIFTFNTYKWVTFAGLITYTLLKTWSFYTGANGLESGIPLGKPGAILSAGLILPLNICVGLVVACTMYAFYSLFSKGGFGNGQ
jgi:multicomponent Na+:H+ antiporter subunit B